MCVRSAADTLLKLPGAPESVGLKAAAQDLLDAVDAFRPPATNAAGNDFGAPPGSEVAGPAWDRVAGAAQVLRGELERPGGYHRGRARGVIERLTGVTLGAAQERALDVWGVVSGLASGIRHGRAAGPDDAVLPYTKLLDAARELLVPLPERAARVLELTALTQPGADEAAELARWADPRAEAYCFRSGPAPVWLGVLAVHAPLLARAVLDLAAADAAAGLPLADRLRAWPRIAQADAGLHDRVLAAHLAAHLPGPGTDAAAAREWWDLAVEATVRMLAGRPTPEGARLAALVLATCPPSRAPGLQQRVLAALGEAPPAAVADQLLPAGPDQAGRADGAVEPLASWLRVWAWSPVLPAPLLASFVQLLAALRRFRPAGPPDPRTAARPRSRHHTAVAVEDLRELAAAAGPLAAAAALAGAPDAGVAGYAAVLQRLVGADPAAWTADIPAVLAALARPELGALYPAAAAVVRHPDAFPAGPAEAVHAALIISCSGRAPARALLQLGRGCYFRPSRCSAVTQSEAMACWAAVRVTRPLQMAVCRRVSTLSLSLFGPAPGLCPGLGGSTQRLRGSFGSPPSCSETRWSYSASCRLALSVLYPYEAAFAIFSRPVTEAGGRILEV